MKKQLPIDGQTRYVLIFPLLPIICNSQEMVWLEWAVIKQRYTYGHGSVLEGWENCGLAKDSEAQQSVQRTGLIALFAGLFSATPRR